jgi:hypothetical protein
LLEVRENERVKAPASFRQTRSQYTASTPTE